jgi:hypothetical protein
MLVALINEKTEEAVLDRCIGFRTEDAFEEDPTLSLDQDATFLKTVVQYNFLRFAPSLLAKFSERSPYLSRAWEKGLLDAAVLVLLRQSNGLLEENDSYRSLADSILSRAVSVLSNIVSTSPKSRKLHSVS